MITTKCNSCGTEKTFSDDKVGKKFKCPVCGEIVLIDTKKDNNIHESKIIESLAIVPTQTKHQKDSESENLKKEFKDVGQEFKEVGKELGEAFKDVGNEFKKYFPGKNKSDYKLIN